eukprot:5576339-Pyramimonas_sp.AAC.1
MVVSSLGIPAAPPAAASGCASRATANACRGLQPQRKSVASLQVRSDSHRSHKLGVYDPVRPVGQLRLSREVPAPGSTSSLFARESFVRTSHGTVRAKSALRSVGGVGGAKGSITMGRHGDSAVRS